MKEKNIQGVFSLENLMKRQLAALVHCVRRTALMRVTDMTGTDNWWNYQCKYTTEEICIATIGSAVDTEK